MRTTESVVVPASAATVYPFVADLSQYPRWMHLVHRAEPVPPTAGGQPAWSVEVRARIGPFARSKQLRMERIDAIDGELAVFERVEVDGRRHARWALRVQLTADETGAATTVTMHLAYDGRLWIGGTLERELDEHVRRGRDGLARLVAPTQTP